MGSENLSINMAQEMGQEMESKTKPATEQKVAYSGQYIQMVEGGGFRPSACMRWGRHDVAAKHGSPWLLAYPRKPFELDKAEYLLRMIEEAKDVYDDVFKGGERGDIYMDALVRRADVLHSVVVGEGGNVRIKPWWVNCLSFVRASDDVEAEAVDGGNVIHRGNFAIVTEGEGGLLRAYVVPSTRLRPAERMAYAIMEVEGWFKELMKGWDVKAVAMQGLVWRGDVAYRPVIYGLDDVEFVVANESYAEFVHLAEKVYFGHR